MSIGETQPPSPGLIRELIADKGESPTYLTQVADLKRSSIIHYLVRSQRFSVPDAVTKTWKTRAFGVCSPEQFLLAATGLAGIRDTLIYGSEDIWPEDCIQKAIKYLDMVLKSCQ
jgi:hypothetical protein